MASLLLAGCGHGKPRANGSDSLTFESLDTTALATGAPLLTTLEPYRMANGAVRVRGALRMPDDTRFQISIEDPATGDLLARCQVSVEGGRFDSPPLLGPKGILPHGRYLFEMLTHFNEAWQPAHVLAETDRGRALRGPGIRRANAGEAAFYLREERTL